MLIDREKCRGWRMCVSGCPYKKIYFNWSSAASPRSASSAIRASRRASRPSARKPASGRIRYLGVMLHDADRIGKPPASAMSISTGADERLLRSGTIPP